MTRKLLIATPKMLTFETGGTRRDLTLFNSSESCMAVELRGVNAQKYKVAIDAAILGPASLVKIPIERSKHNYPNDAKVRVYFVLVSSEATDAKLAISEMSEDAQHGELEINLKSI